MRYIPAPGWDEQLDGPRDLTHRQPRDQDGQPVDVWADTTFDWVVAADTQQAEWITSLREGLELTERENSMTSITEVEVPMDASTLDADYHGLNRTRSTLQEVREGTPVGDALRDALFDSDLDVIHRSLTSAGGWNDGDEIAAVLLTRGRYWLATFIMYGDFPAVKGEGEFPEFSPVSARAFAGNPMGRAAAKEHFHRLVAQARAERVAAAEAVSHDEDAAFDTGAFGSADWTDAAEMEEDAEYAIDSDDD